jgi:hypothetical protein
MNDLELKIEDLECLNKSLECKIIEKENYINKSINIKNNVSKDSKLIRNESIIAKHSCNNSPLKKYLGQKSKEIDPVIFCASDERYNSLKYKYNNLRSEYNNLINYNKKFSYIFDKKEFLDALPQLVEERNLLRKKITELNKKIKITIENKEGIIKDLQEKLRLSINRWEETLSCAQKN